uniref:Golgin subfamily A member 4 n=1 Tax=Schistosoma haematobium TaxID=6185 RepID=A0A094ZP29_SCHHA
MFNNLKGLVKKEGTSKGESERTDADIAFERRTSSVQLKPTSSSVKSNHGRINDITDSNSDSNVSQNKSPTSKETDNVKLLKCTNPFGELDDSDCGSVMSSTFRLSTETSDIQSRCQRVYQMARNYKIKYQQLVEAYKVMESERNNLQQLLASHQTKTSKSVDEMYKKLELDKQTKDELERDFRQLLSEKEEIIKSLRLQCDQQNINKLRSELADSKLSQAALQEQVQCLKAQFYNNSNTEETGIQNEFSNKLSVSTESNYIHHSNEIINNNNEQSNEIKSLSCQLEELNKKLADSEDIRTRLDKEVNELKSTLASAKSEINTTIISDHPLNNESINSELINLKSLNSELTIQLNEYQFKIEHLESIQIDQLEQIDLMKSELNLCKTIKEENDHFKIYYDSLLNQIKQLKLNIFNLNNEKLIELYPIDENDSINFNDLENFKLFIELLLHDTFKTIDELKLIHNNEINNLLNQFNELQSKCNDKQSIIDCLQSKLMISQSNEQKQLLLIDELNEKINNLQDNSTNDQINIENYSNLQLKYKEIELQLNMIQNQLKSTNLIKEEELENQLADSKQFNEKNKQLNESLNNNNNNNNNENQYIDLNQMIIELKQDLNVSNEKYLQLLNDYNNLNKQLINNGKQLQINENKFIDKSLNELLIVNNKLNNYQFKLNKKYKSEINLLKYEMEHNQLSLNNPHYLEMDNQSLQQTLNTTKNQFESMQSQFIDKCASESVYHNTELQNIQTELTEAHKRIENLQCQLYSSIEQNTRLAKTMEEEHIDTLSEYQQHVYELIRLSNEACELLLKQSEQFSSKLNPIWNILETADQRLALINTNVDSILMVTGKRFQTYTTSIERLQNEMTIIKGDLVTRNDVVNNLNMELEKKQDEINNLHLTLDKYNSFNQTIRNFICNDHRQLCQNLIKLCQSKINWIVTEMNESKQNLNNTDIENNNNEQDLYNEYNQIELDAKTLNESFNTTEHLMFANFNSECNVNYLELICNWLNSESYTTFTDNLFKNFHKLDILDTRSQILHKEFINNFKNSIVHNHQSNIDELHIQLDLLKNQCNELNNQLIQLQLNNQTLIDDQKLTDEKYNSMEVSLMKANQMIDEFKQNELILKENYTNQLKLFEESQQTIFDLNKQLELITEKSNRLSNELTEKETVCDQLQNELQRIQLEHANILENYKIKHTDELNDLNKKYEMEKSQYIEQLNTEHQTALKSAVDNAIFIKEKQMKQQNLELRNRLKQVLQELETSKKSSATPSRREIELQNILHETEEKLKQLQLEHADQCKSCEKLQIKIEELESRNLEINDNSKKNQQDLWDHNCDSASEIHEKYQMQIELLKTEQANYIQEITREFEQKLSTNEREVITRQNIEIDQTLTKLKQMEQSHSKKLAYFEETISDYDRQNTRLKNRIIELQSELKRLTENNNTVEAKYEPIKVVDTPVTTSTQPIVSRHEVDVQCNIKLNENNSLINTTTNNNICNHDNGTVSSTELCSEVNNNTHLQSNDECDDWIEKVRQEILQSDSLDSLHPALRQSRYPTSVPIRDYEALQLHNTDLQNQLQQLSADFEALRSKCTAACSSASNKHSLFESLHVHAVDSTVKLNNSSFSFNSIPPDYQHVLLTSPSDNRLHELVEYEYLKNVLFEYMQGRETQTLSKVLCSLMRFNADQTRKVLSYEDQKSKDKVWISTAIFLISSLHQSLFRSLF